MFPKEAVFICRHCLKHFFFRPEMFADIAANKKIECPGCGKQTKRAGDVERFFKFYPRFTDAIEQIKTTGFEFTNYQFGVDRFNCFWFKDMEFKCLSCGSCSRHTLNRLEKFAEEPGLFGCISCHVHPKPLKIVKEFFVSFRWVDRSASNTLDFLWDILTPRQLLPGDYPIQWPIARSIPVPGEGHP